MTAPAAPPPDSRDWTFVITDGCEECGFTPQPPGTTSERIRATIPIWREALAGETAQADQWDRPGRRSNGSIFTVGTLAIYFLHDIEHHVHDVT